MRKMNTCSQLVFQKQLKKSMSWTKYNLSLDDICQFGFVVRSGLEAAFDGGILDNFHCSSPEKVSRYKIPMWKKQGSNSVSDTQSVTCFSSSEENRNLRPVRAKRKPNWMRSNDRVLG